MSDKSPTRTRSLSLMMPSLSPSLKTKHGLVIRAAKCSASEPTVSDCSIAKR